MSDADCTPGREPRSVAASFYCAVLMLWYNCDADQGRRYAVKSAMATNL